MPLRSWAQKLFRDQALALPEGTRLGPTDISLRGDRLIEIALCTGICVYTRQKIGVYINEGRLTVCGEDLTLKTYRDRRITISGRIREIHFEKP